MISFSKPHVVVLLLGCALMTVANSSPRETASTQENSCWDFVDLPRLFPSSTKPLPPSSSSEERPPPFSLASLPLSRFLCLLEFSIVRNISGGSVNHLAFKLRILTSFAATAGDRASFTSFPCFCFLRLLDEFG